MDRALSLFRIFDIAFFAPGALIFASIYQTGWISWPGDQSPTSVTIASLLFLVLSLGAVYTLGLVIHGWQRLLLHKPFRKMTAAKKKASWFTELDDHRLEDLRLYFWYLRATCFNLVVALPVAGLILAFDELYCSTSPSVPGLLAGLGGMVLAEVGLFFLGRDFDRALGAAKRFTPPHAGDTARTPPEAPLQPGASPPPSS